MKTQRGITLIALIITVIVLLILAGTAVSIAINGGDLFSKATDARRSWNDAVAEENTIINNWIEQIEQYTNGANPGDIQSVGVTVPDELATKIANNEDLTEIEITLPTVSGYYKWDKEYCSNTDHTMIMDINDNWTESDISVDLDLYTGTIPSGVTAYASGSASGSGEYDMTVDDWRILRVNDNGTIDLIPLTKSKPDIPLGGSQGYNNGVNLLNEACSALYGDASKGITARSINLEDIEEFASQTALNTVKDDEYYGQQVATPYSSARSKYPAIYAEENNSVINGGNPLSNGLGQSDNRGSGFISRSSGLITDVNSIQPFRTTYTTYLNVNAETFGSKANILLTSQNSNKFFGIDSYWIATRGIWYVNNEVYDDVFEGVYYNLYICDGNNQEYIESWITSGCLYNSNSYSNDNTIMWYSLCPIVTLNSGSLIGSGNSYTFVPAD